MTTRLILGLLFFMVLLMSACGPSNPWPDEGFDGYVIGDEVRLKGAETFKPEKTRHPNPILAQEGHIGIVKDGTGRDGETASWAVVEWAPGQYWVDEKTKKLVKLGAFEHSVGLLAVRKTRPGELGLSDPAKLEAVLEAERKMEVARTPKNCTEGKCVQGCREHTCTAFCKGGGCVQTCKAKEFCVFGCEGGGCVQTCEPGSSCRISCTPKDCTRDFELFEASVTIDDTSEPRRSY